MLISIKNSDFVGVCSSVLCMLHCMLSPILFMSQTQTVNISIEIPFLWQSVNYIFLFISMIAVYFSIKNSTKLFVKILLAISWLSLSFLIINEGLEGFHFPEIYTYISASLLSIFHIYNLKYCTCNEEDECCVH
jgi:hypothetical protein